MKEQHTGIGICHCRQCRLTKRHRRGKRVDKRAINKFRCRQLKSEDVIKHNRFGGYWA